MASRKIVSSQDEARLIEPRVGPGRYEIVGVGIHDLQRQLMAGLDQARRGELAEGRGEDVIRRAVAAVLKRP
ncbi:hypothetical protein [Elstera cyanobacteriorum]|uniref:hypothetical protein n=1 Tax=Elstera cyanobacteriorum TaxID=2022747 RepID=UPI002355825E|nr:hypothetical protein [Elstera cyanobacteriorum]MCK6444689.1 hypothetical protein [Elstera cyanobacteriorum]